MIELKQLTKYFGEHPVVQNADAEFEKGKVTAIIGPNGLWQKYFVVDGKSSDSA